MASSACCFRAAWRTLTRIFSVRTNISHPRRFCSSVTRLSEARAYFSYHPVRLPRINPAASKPSWRSHISARPGKVV
jgi:hypothetical protein